MSSDLPYKSLSHDSPLPPFVLSLLVYPFPRDMLNDTLVNHTKSLWNMLALGVSQLRQIQTTALECVVRGVPGKLGLLLCRSTVLEKDVRRR